MHVSIRIHLSEYRTGTTVTDQIDLSPPLS